MAQLFAASVACCCACNVVGYFGMDLVCGSLLDLLQSQPYRNVSQGLWSTLQETWFCVTGVHPLWWFLQPAAEQLSSVALHMVCLLPSEINFLLICDKNSELKVHTVPVLTHTALQQRSLLPLLYVMPCCCCCAAGCDAVRNLDLPPNIFLCLSNGGCPTCASCPWIPRDYPAAVNSWSSLGMGQSLAC